VPERLAYSFESCQDDLSAMVRQVWDGWRGRTMRSAIVALLICTSAFAADPPKPSPEPPLVAPTVADVLKANADAEAAIIKAKATFEAWKKDAAKIDPSIAKLDFAIGKASRPGPPGKDGHSPVLTWGTGADSDRIAIDGKFTGPHLTGPPGPPAPVPVDAFVKAVQDAYTASPEANKATLTSNFAAVFQAALDGKYVDTDPETGVLLARMLVARKLKIQDNELVGLRKVVTDTIQPLMGPSEASQPLTDAASGVGSRAAIKAQFQKIIDAIKAVK